SCSYREIGDNEEAYNFARKLVDVSDSLEHKLHYAGILFLKSEDECENYLDTLNERYGNNKDFQQVYFKLLLDITIERMKKAPDTDVEAFFRKYIDRTKYENEAVLDNKARVRIAEAYLAKAQSLGIENKIIDNDFYNEFIENKNYINYATTRHSQGMGCLMFILVFAANWFLSGFFDKFVHSFWISNALSLALLSNIVLYYNYPKGWQINRRKKG
ncbi:TPA: molecular chaperone DnaJ, partial [Streptococcus pneumoniae]|nr:molecular chaperone DnaJ [Streptococcus pneumoniae]HEU9957716.1 molecular chaperone DnaJ [Streptococcus pneumoniae]